MAGKLPRILSKAMRLSTADARKLNRRLYVPHFMHFHSVGKAIHGKIERRCAVCYAGAAIAGTLGLDRDTRVMFDDEAHGIDPEDSEVIDALDSVRCGDFYNALNTLGILPAPDQTDALAGEAFDPSEYSHFKTWKEFDLFLKDMDQQADALEFIGL